MTCARRAIAFLQQPMSRLVSYHCLTLDVRVMMYHETGRVLVNSPTNVKCYEVPSTGCTIQHQLSNALSTSTVTVSSLALVFANQEPWIPKFTLFSISFGKRYKFKGHFREFSI